MRILTRNKAALVLWSAVGLLVAPVSGYADDPASFPTLVSPNPRDGLTPGSIITVQFTPPMTNADGTLDPASVSAWLADDNFTQIGSDFTLTSQPNAKPPTYYTYTCEIQLPYQPNTTFQIGWQATYSGVGDGNFFQISTGE